MTSFTQSKIVVGWGLNWFLLFDFVWMIGTKLVHVYEGAVRYPIGWVKDCNLVVSYCLYE